MKGIRNGYLSRQKWKGKGLDLQEEPRACNSDIRFLQLGCRLFKDVDVGFGTDNSDDNYNIPWITARPQELAFSISLMARLLFSAFFSRESVFTPFADRMISEPPKNSRKNIIHGEVLVQVNL